MKCGGGDRGDWVDGVNNTFSILDFTSFKYVTCLLTNKTGCVVYRYFWGWRGKQRMERQNKIITVCIIYQFLLGVKDAGEQGIEWEDKIIYRSATFILECNKPISYSQCCPHQQSIRFCLVRYYIYCTLG